MPPIETQSLVDSDEKMRNDLRKMRFIEQLAESIVSAIEKQKINNFDEVKLHLRTELGRVFKPTLGKLEAINSKHAFSPKTEASLNEFIRRPAETKVLNLGEIKLPTDLTINNLNELEQYFTNLADTIRSTFNVEIPTPQVTVNTPPVTIPETTVNVAMDEVVSAINRLILSVSPLQFMSDKADQALAVRLSDGEEFLKALQVIKESGDRQVQAFSQQAGLTAKEFRSSSRALNQKATAKTNDSVTVGNTSTSVAVANTDRISLTLVNDSDEVQYVSKSVTAVMNKGIRLNALGGSVVIEDYTGAVSAICTSGSKNMTVCEV